jgi:hypothetical protein
MVRLRRGRAAPRTVLVTVFLVAGCGNGVATPVPATPVGSAGPAASATSSVEASPAQPTASSAASGRWVPAGTMNAARGGQAAVVLRDGLVLVVGTDAPSEYATPTTSAELWDPATSAWKRTEGLEKLRSAFGLVALADGRALVIGGLNAAEQSYSSTYIYDPSTESWAKSGLLGTARAGPSAAVLRDGRVLVAGGFYRTHPEGAAHEESMVLAAYRPVPRRVEPELDDVDVPPSGYALASAELFDPAKGTWSAAGPMKFARAGAAAVTLRDGRVLLVGSAGYNVTRIGGDTYNNAEIYDPATNRFSLAGELPPIDRVALQKAGKRGANPVPEYDPEWVGTGTLVALPDGGAVLIGQAGYWKHAGDISRSFRFDAASGKWSQMGRTFVAVDEPGPIPLYTEDVADLNGAAAARFGDQWVLVAGGAGAAATVFDPVTNAWSPVESMYEPRVSGQALTLLDGSVLVLGGSRYQGDERLRLTTTLRFVSSR